MKSSLSSAVFLSFQATVPSSGQPYLQPALPPRPSCSLSDRAPTFLSNSTLHSKDSVTVCSPCFARHIRSCPPAWVTPHLYWSFKSAMEASSLRFFVCYIDKVPGYRREISPWGRAECPVCLQTWVAGTQPSAPSLPWTARWVCQIWRMIPSRWATNCRTWQMWRSWHAFRRRVS